MSIQTGREGEKIVSFLCTQAGVTCNPALEDDNGWDLHLEFPADQLPGTPIDLQPTPHGAFVQVKATRSASKTCRIKLSNALRFAKSPLPCFIVLVQLRGGAARRIYVTHVWTDHIARFLKEGRKADAQRDAAIHKIRIPIEFSSKDDQTDDVIGWIRDQIASHDKSYGTAKQQIVEAVGFENGYGTAKVTFDLASPDDIVDWQLGLKESLSVSRFTFTPERFGIPAGTPQFDAEAGRMYLTPNGRPATLRLSLPSGEHLTIPAELFVSDVPGLSLDRQRWRIRAGCLDISLQENGEVRGKAEIKLDESLPLERIREFTALHNLVKGQSIQAQLACKEQRIKCGRLQFETPPRRGWPYTDTAVKALLKIGQIAMRSDLQLRFADLQKAAPKLIYLTALAGDNSLRAEFRPTEEKRWLHSFGQCGKWNLCLTTGTLVLANQEHP